MGQQHVLIAEDCQETLEVYSELVECMGLLPLRASSGKEALDCFLANREKVALVITDGKIPDGDGVWLAKQIHELEPETPVVLLTGMMAKFIHQKTAFARVIAKPVDFEQLKGIVETYAPRSFLPK